MVTGLRILCSVLMIFLPVFSVRFYIAYFICGLSDAADGAIARKTNSSSPFGARLDTAADLVFVSVTLIKLLPCITVPQWLWLWIAAIALIKAVNAVVWFIRQKKPVAVHSIMNKLTGFLLFLFPLTLGIIEPQYSAAVVCSAATLAAIQEGYYIGTNRGIML